MRVRVSSLVLPVIGSCCMYCLSEINVDSRGKFVDRLLQGVDGDSTKKMM